MCCQDLTGKTNPMISILFLVSLVSKYIVFDLPAFHLHLQTLNCLSGEPGKGSSQGTSRSGSRRNQGATEFSGSNKCTRSLTRRCAAAGGRRARLDGGQLVAADRRLESACGRPMAASDIQRAGNDRETRRLVAGRGAVLMTLQERSQMFYGVCFGGMFPRLSHGCSNLRYHLDRLVSVRSIIQYESQHEVYSRQGLAARLAAKYR